MEELEAQFSATVKSVIKFLKIAAQNSLFCRNLLRLI